MAKIKSHQVKFCEICNAKSIGERGRLDVEDFGGERYRQPKQHRRPMRNKIHQPFVDDYRSLVVTMYI